MSQDLAAAQLAALAAPLLKAAAELTDELKISNDLVAALTIAADANFPPTVRVSQVEAALMHLRELGKRSKPEVLQATEGMASALRAFPIQAGGAGQLVSESIRFVDQLSVKGKKVLVRIDANVPFDDEGNITDDNRLREALPTIVYLLKQGASPILMSHLGEGDKKVDSLKPVALRMADLLRKEIAACEVIFAPDCIDADAVAKAKALKPNQVLMLENLRFHAGEKKNAPDFAAQIASLGEMYVNDAFGTAHRAHASIVGVPAKFGADARAAGLLVKKELTYFERALLKPETPLCIVIGGAKVSSKLKVLINLADKSRRGDILVIGGAMANTFLAGRGLELGKSLVEKELIPTAQALLALLRQKGVKVFLPVDAVVGSSPDHGPGRAVPVEAIPADMMALDVGPASIELFKLAVQSAKTILWNGPLGRFEVADYARGTRSLAETMAGMNGVLRVAGGGDTGAALDELGLSDKFDHRSTGGGASLALLEDFWLPAFTALKK